MTTVIPTLIATRLALHAVAEQVLAAALFQATGRIGLRPTPGGFGTPVFDDGRQLRIDGLDLVVAAGADGERRAPLTTVRAAADFAGITPGAPDIYPAATPVDLDRPLDLDLDPAAAAVVHGWFAATGEALDALGGPGAQLWPEHFDLAVALDEVNYGGSPGDADHEAPYAYVGPWNPSAVPPAPFWNEPFGASRPAGPVADLVAFFQEGRVLCQSAA